MLHQIIHIVQQFVQQIPFPRSAASSSTRDFAAKAAEEAGKPDAVECRSAKSAKARFERLCESSSPESVVGAKLWQDIDNMATVRFQRTAIDLLHRLAVQYLSACHSVVGDRSDDAKRQITMAIMMCLSDRIARINVLDGLTTEQAARLAQVFGCNYLPLSLVLSGVPFREEDIINVDNDDEDALHAKIRRQRVSFLSFCAVVVGYFGRESVSCLKRSLRRCRTFSHL